MTLKELTGERLILALFAQQMLKELRELEEKEKDGEVSPTKKQLKAFNRARLATSRLALRIYKEFMK